jgi:hypothetical protein
MMMRYRYLGDRMTDPNLAGQPCDPVRRADGRVVIGRKPRNQLVRFADGTEAVVLARRLRIDPLVKLGEETERQRIADDRDGRTYL